MYFPNPVKTGVNFIVAIPTGLDDGAQEAANIRPFGTPPDRPAQSLRRRRSARQCRFVRLHRCADRLRAAVRGSRDQRAAAGGQTRAQRCLSASQPAARPAPLQPLAPAAAPPGRVADRTVGRRAGITTGERDRGQAGDRSDGAGWWKPAELPKPAPATCRSPPVDMPTPAPAEMPRPVPVDLPKPAPLTCRSPRLTCRSPRRCRRSFRSRHLPTSRRPSFRGRTSFRSSCRRNSIRPCRHRFRPNCRSRSTYRPRRSFHRRSRQQIWFLRRCRRRRCRSCPHCLWHRHRSYLHCPWHRHPSCLHCHPCPRCRHRHRCPRCRISPIARRVSPAVLTAAQTPVSGSPSPQPFRPRPGFARRRRRVRTRRAASGRQHTRWPSASRRRRRPRIAGVCLRDLKSSLVMRVGTRRAGRRLLPLAITGLAVGHRRPVDLGDV